MRTAYRLLIFFFGLIPVQQLRAQAQLQPWGNLTGISDRGELLKWETNISVTNGAVTMVTAKEAQRPSYHRVLNTQTVMTHLGNLALKETVTDTLPGTAVISVLARPDSADFTGDICFHIRIPVSFTKASSFVETHGKHYALQAFASRKERDPLRLRTEKISVISATRTHVFSFPSAVEIQIGRGAAEDSGQLAISIPVHRGSLGKDAAAAFTLYAKSSGLIDDKPVHVRIDSTIQGRPFAGLGGNFRIQNLRHDPQVIDYCLRNMRVAWARVELPWRFWQPLQRSDPAAEARAGRLDSHVVRAMEMVRTLAGRGIPIVLSAWFPPDWAITGKPMFRHAAGEPWGNALNQDSAAAIYRSIAAYIAFLKENYGVTIKYFSFNESDLGINVRQTPDEHAKLIRELGKYFAAQGIGTKLLLGDNSDATTYRFIDAALKDSSCHPYIGAVSFHSWRGCDSANLSHWVAAARQLQLPLLVGEGSIDAAAWAYPEIFGEQIYAQEEISLYVRLLAFCQPESILQWQLTADYSPLTGAGIFGSTGPLAPTWRFWNLKQLAATPSGQRFVKISADNDAVVAAALTDSLNQSLTVHLVNNGPARKLSLSGIPGAITTVRVMVTSATRAMETLATLHPKAGELQMEIPQTSFITLLGAEATAQRGPVDKNAGVETHRLYENLHQSAGRGFLFGHQDDLAYGVHWQYEPGNSDVKQVTGSYPALYGWELGRIELDSARNLDGVPFDKMRDFIREGYARGGVITISWHLNNPLTGKSAWDPAPPGSVSAVLPGGSKHDLYRSWLDKVSVFLGSLKDEQGKPIPVILRLFHELNGDWFWWGGKNCTPAEFKSMWQFTVSYLRDTRGLHNLLFAFNTDRFSSEENYLSKYPGNEWADILGFDIYQGHSIAQNAAFTAEFDRTIGLLEQIASAHDKIPALTEFGYNQLPDSTWWTSVFLPVMTRHRLAYAMAWRNAGRKKDGSTEFYVPYPGQGSAEDFKRFRQSGKAIFGEELADKKLYR